MSRVCMWQYQILVRLSNDNEAILLLLANHSVSKNNYEIHLHFRIRIIKKQELRVYTSSLHYNCHIYNYNIF